MCQCVYARVCVCASNCEALTINEHCALSVPRRSLSLSRSLPFSLPAECRCNRSNNFSFSCLATFVESAV